MASPDRARCVAAAVEIGGRPRPADGHILALHAAEAVAYEAARAIWYGGARKRACAADAIRARATTMRAVETALRNLAP